MLAANAPSSATLPFMIGMWLNLPVVHAVSPGIGRTLPSTIRPFTYGPFAGRGALQRQDLLHAQLAQARRGRTVHLRRRNLPLWRISEPRCSASSQRRDREQRPAFEDRAMEQAGARRRYHQGGGAGRAGRLATHRDVARVAAERGDIALHPAKRFLLVHQSVVAEVMAFGIERGMAEIAQQAEAVVDRDDDGRAGRAALDERAGVIVVALAVEQSAAMDPDQDRKLLAVARAIVGVWREDVQVRDNPRSRSPGRRTHRVR